MRGSLALAICQVSAERSGMQRSAATGALRAWIARIAILFLAIGLPIAAGAQSGAPLFSFAQISDPQARSVAEWTRFEGVLDTLADSGTPGALLPRRVSFVLFAGDLVFQASSTAAWNQLRSAIDTRLTANGIPYRAVPGNHDQDGFGVGNYEAYIGSASVWDTGSSSVSGHNGVSATTGWRGLRIIGFNNSNGAWNQISSGDLESIGSRVAAAATAHENVLLLGHHPHNGQSVTPLASLLMNPAIVGYCRGHSGNPRAVQGLSGISNPSVWDLNTNAIVEEGAILYYEVFANQIRVYVIQLILNPISLPAPKAISLAFPITASGPARPLADFALAPASGTAPLSVVFTDLSTGAPTSWLWSFGDGSSSGEQHPTHRYSAPGVYDVGLSAANASASSAMLKPAAVRALALSPSLTFPATADARVSSSTPNSNFGSDPTLRIRAGSPTYQSYLRFAVSGLGSASILSARLRVFVTDASPDGGVLYSVADPWSESSISFGNAPPLSGAPLASAAAVAADQWVEYDVSSLVRGEGSYAFGLASGSTNSAYFSSREGAHPPELVIETGAPTALAADFAATPIQGAAPLPVAFSDLSSGGPTAWQWSFGDAAVSTEQHPTHVYAKAGLYAVDLVVSNAGGSATLLRNAYVSVDAALPVAVFTPAADTKLNSSKPASNYGTAVDLRVRGASTSDWKTFLRFDVSGLPVPATRATLRLFANDGSRDSGILYRAPTSWSETALSWANAPALDPAAVTALGATVTGQWIELDVTSAVTGNGSIGFGIESSNSDSAYFSSREGANPPQLVIEWAQ